MPPPRRKRKPVTVIGLTGGIASGKSTAARHLASLGAHVLDADRLGHQAYKPGGHAHRQIIETFGAEVAGADGVIDRKVLGGKVFGAPAAMRRLTDIVWPEIGRLAKREIDSAARRHRIIVLEAAVLLEAGWDAEVDEVWVVLAEPKVALARAMARDGLTRAQVEARMKAQLSNDERRRRAGRVLENSGEPAKLRRQLDEAWRELTEAG